MISESDMDAVVRAVRSFRPGAPIVVDDVRFACRVDGHPIDHIASRKEGPLGSHDRVSWMWGVGE